MKKLLIILLALSILIIISCDKTTKPDNGDDEYVELSDETIVIDETNLSQPEIDSTGTYYSYTFTGDAPEININDVIIGQTDNGYLRKVTNVEINGNEIVLQTEQACLTDAIKECNVKNSIQLTIGKESKSNGMYCTYLAKGVTVERGGINLDNTTLYSGNVGNVTISATIPDGYVSFEPYLNRELEIGFIPPRVEHLLLLVEGILKYDCDLKITTSDSIDYEKEILLANFISPPFPIGPVPCFIEFSFVAGFETQLDVEGTIKSGFDSEASVEFGAEYNHGSGWNDIWNKSFEFNDNPIEWELTGDVFAKGYITPQITLKIAGVLGPDMEVEPYLKFDGNVTIPTSWDWELLGGVDGNLGFEVEILSFSLADFNTNLLNWETIIASDSGVFDSINVTSPNGGETWQMGTSYNITWSDSISSNVKIDLYKSGTYNREIEDSTPSNGTYSWSIPTDLTESSNYKVKITSTSNDSLYDYSDNYFTIEEADSINVTSPNGGETWQMGTSYNITWSDNISSNVKIDLYKSGTYNREIKDSTPSNGTYSWSIPTDLTESSDYKIRITSTSNSSVNDQSNNYFTIEEEPQADYITVTQPNGGETWQMGTSYNITWSDNISSNVKIDLYKSGTYNREIEDSTPSNGTYSWSIPTDLTESSDYKIKITSTSDSSVNDQSNNYFTIEEEPQVNEPPDQPSNPSPSDNAPCVSTSTNLSWTCSDPDGDPLTYDVYFGTSSSPPLVNSGQSSTTYDPGTLNEETTYYWKIKAHDDHSNSTTGDVWQFTTTSGGTGTVTDIDGNVYQTIIIGNQEWMMENLKVTRYRNGDLIPNVTDDDEWENTSNGAYCIYDNDPSNADTYGNLYNWYAVDDTRGLAPACWHVPTDDDWKELEMFLGMTQAQADSIECRGTNEGSKLAGGDLWDDGDLVNNAEFGTSGFTALPGGGRLWGSFWDIGYGAGFWSSSVEYSTNYAWYRALGDWTSEVYRYIYYLESGMSVRCVRTVE